MSIIFKERQIGARITSQSEGAARTEGRRLNTKTSPKGEVLEVNIRVRIRVMVRMLIFFDFVDVFTQKRTRVIASIRFANARSRMVVLVIGKIVTGGFES